MDTLAALLYSFLTFFRRIPVRLALVAILAFAIGATGLQAYPITLTINGTFGSPPTSGTDPLGLAGTAFSVTTSVDTVSNPGPYPLGATNIVIHPFAGPPSTIPGSGGTASLSSGGGSTVVTLSNVADLLGTFSASATVPSSVVGSTPAPFPATTFSNGSVTYTITAASSSTTLSATGTVGGTTTATNISASPGSLSFSYLTGNPNPPNQSFQVLNASAVPYVATVAPGASWLSIASGATGTTPGTVAVAVNPAGLTAGTYNGSITVTSTGAPNTLMVPVSLTVTAPVLPTFIVSPTALTFNYTSGGTIPPGQLVSLNSSGSSISFTDSATTSSGGAWLSTNASSGSTPGGISVLVSPSSLAPGTYTGTVTITPTGAANGPQAVSVTLNVAPPPPTFSAAPSTLTFSYQAGSSTFPSSQPVSLTTNGASVTFTDSVSTTSGGSWLSASPGAGSTPGSVNVSVSPGSLTTGVYSGTVTFTPTGAANGPQTVNVTLNVTPPPTLSLSTNTATFNYQIGSSAPPSQPVTVTTSTSGISFSAASDSPWLVVAPAGGTTPGAISLSLNTASLTTPGTLTGHITVSAAGVSNSPQIVTVTANVTPAPNIQASPSSLSFAYQLTGSQPPTQMLNVTSSGTPLTYTVGSSAPWLVVTGGGSTPGTVNVDINTAGLTAQTYNGTVTITAAGSNNGSVAIPVTLIVSNLPTLSATPSVLSFTSTFGAGAPSAQSVAVASTSGSIAYTIATATTSGGPWLSVTPTSGTTPGSFSASVSPTSLAIGTYNGTITLTAPGTSNSPLVINVTYSVTMTPALTSTPGTLTFNFQQGGAAPASQPLAIGGTDGLSYTAVPNTVSGGNWLVLDSTTGTTPGTINVSVATDGLAPGTYTGTITSSAPGATSAATTVTLNITSAPFITAAPASLTYNYTAGSSTLPTDQTVALTSSGSALDFTAGAVTVSGGPWLSVAPAAATTPASVTVSVNPAGLIAGTYTGTVTITSPAAGNSPQTVSVTLNVAPPSAVLSAAPASLTFTYTAGSGSFPADQTLALTSSGTPIDFTDAVMTTSGGSWLSVAPGGGTTPATLTVSVAPGSLIAGSYSGSVTITPSGGTPVNIPVTINVAPTIPALSASPNPISFSYQAGSATLPSPQTISISSAGTPVDYTAAIVTYSGGNWLAISPLSGTTPGSLVLTPMPSALVAGSYTASLTITAAGVTNSPLVIPITLTVTSAAVLSASPSSLTFNFTTGGAVPGSQTLSVFSSGSPLTFTAAASSAAWLVVSGGGTTPSSVSISANPAGMPAGIYNASVILTPAGGSPLVIPVTLNVVSIAALAPSPGALTFNFQIAGSAPAPQTLSVGSTGSALPFGVSLTNLPWLTVTPTSGTTGVTTLTATANPAGLAAGTYGGQITLSSGTSPSPAVIPVTLVVSAAPLSPVTSSQTPVIFNYLVGGALPAAKTVNLTSASPTPYTVSASAATWLAVTPASGTTPGSITITANPGTLAPGSYAANVSVASAGNAPLVIPVFLSITAAPVMTAFPESLAFAFQSGGTPPAPQNISVGSTGVAFTTTSAAEGSWLSVTPSSAISPGTFTVTANPAGLLPGLYNGSVTFSAAATNSPISVPVALLVAGGPAISASPISLSFSFQSGGANPPSQTVALASTAGPLAFTAASTPPWLTLVSPPGGTAPGTLTVTANPAGLATGSYSGTITLTPTAGGSAITLPVEFDVNSTTTPNLAAVSNALSYAVGSVAPGEFVTLWGKGLGPVAPAGVQLTPSGIVSSNIGNVRVFFDGIPAVLTLASDLQINAIVPTALAGSTSTVVHAEYLGVKSNALTLSIAPSAPGLATFDASGMGEGAILNQDSSVNSTSNPAAPGSVVVLFGTGGGATNPVGIDGFIPGSTFFAPTLPVSVTIGGLDAPVQYAGPSPTLVSGVLQINVQVPSALGPGPQPVVLKVGTASSQSGYTVVIK